MFNGFLKKLMAALIFIPVAGTLIFAASKPAPLTFPISKTPLELPDFVAFNPAKAGGIKSYSEMTIYKVFAQKTNITMKFIHPPVGQEEEQLNLMVASRSFPSIVEWNWLNYIGGPEKAIQDGVAIPLNDLINKYAPNLKKILTKNPAARKQIMTDNGTIYCFPFLRLDPGITTAVGLQIRKNWLDKLHLKEPQTIDDWYKMLKAFKEKDPNGNGKADEIPFTAMKFDGLNNRWEFAGLNPFLGCWGIGPEFYQIHNKVRYGPVQPQYKQFLTTMNKWYKEGLVDPGFMANDVKQRDSLISSDRAGAWNGQLSGDMGRLIQLNRVKNPDFSIIGAAFPIGPAGKAYNFDRETIRVFPGVGAAITKNNKHVIETVKYLDYGYSDEGHRYMNYGVEGVSYEMVNGAPKFKEVITNNPKYSIDQGIGTYCRGVGQPPTYFELGLMMQRWFLPEQQEASKKWRDANTSRVMPPVTMSPEEARKYASIMNDVNTYVEEMTAKFITGQVPLAQFDTYLKTLNQLGIKDAIQMQQDALNRFQKRK